jgi:hypothetical protein
MLPRIAARVSLGALALVAACDRPAPTARERMLARIPGDAVTVVVADGAAISHPRIRGVIDVIAARWPASMACVVQAAFASDQAALSVDRRGNVSALIATSAVPRCPTLSQREPGLWIATIGAPPADAPTSVLGDPRFARARPYLATAAIAGASLGEARVLATAQPDPLEAWLAIDVAGSAEAVEQAISEQVTRMKREASTSAVAAMLGITRSADAQVVVRFAPGEPPPIDADLAACARTVLAWIAERARPQAATFTCPAPAPQISCSNGTSYRVGSLRDQLAPIVAQGQPSPVVSNGAVNGLRLGAAVVQLGLAAGDVVIAMGGRLVTSRAMLAEWIAQARGETTVTIRRGNTEKVLKFAER